MIYFDNAATSFPKPGSVIRATNDCIKRYCGNPGRSSHALSNKSAEMIYSAREAVADLLGGVEPEGVVFTYNATYALNLAIKSFVDSDCHIITSDFEHNSVIRPIEALKKRYKIDLSFFADEREIESLIRNETTGIICTLGSNVTGDSFDLKRLSDIAKKNNLFLIVDASQTIGHRNIDLINAPCDVLCAPGHKALFGIQGSGFAVFKNLDRKIGLVEGGSGSDSERKDMPPLLPEGYEAGTLATPVIVSLQSGIKYIKDIGLDNIQNKLDCLIDAMYERLTSLSSAKVYKRGNGIISFNLGDLPSSAVAYELDRLGICTRAGLHCAPSVHRRLGTLKQGTVRISFSYFNSLRQIDSFYKAIRSIEKMLL